VAKAATSAAENEPLSYNLQGQRLGRKGRDTRERILAAAEKLLAGPPGPAVTLSAVAREASLAMTTLYLYFSDLTELLIAVMQRIMASAETRYIGKLRGRWADDAVSERCLDFVESFHAFWAQHARLLHMRNSIADEHDERMLKARVQFSREMIELFVDQMDGDTAAVDSPIFAMGSVLLTGIERLITVTTDVNFPNLPADPARVRSLLAAEARLLELAIVDGRVGGRAQPRLEAGAL
jgi:AcrR family transcriptional regulator